MAEPAALTHVLDASAILALGRQESGGDEVAALLPSSALSAVTLVEAHDKLRRLGIDIGRLAELLVAAEVRIMPFTLADVAFAGAVQGLDETRRSDLEDGAPANKRRRLSLGDQCCLALALRLELPAVTADDVWSDLGDPVEVQLFR